MPGTSVHAASWHTTTDQTGPRSHGSGWPKRVSSQLDWPHKSFRPHPLRPAQAIQGGRHTKCGRPTFTFLYEAVCLDGNHLHSELGGALGQRTQVALAVALLAVVPTLVGVVLALGEHGVDQEFRRSMASL